MEMSNSRKMKGVINRSSCLQMFIQLVIVKTSNSTENTLLDFFTELLQWLLLNKLKGTNSELKISLHVWVHVKTIPLKFRILNSKNSRYIYP